MWLNFSCKFYRSSLLITLPEYNVFLWLLLSKPSRLVYQHYLYQGVSHGKDEMIVFVLLVDNVHSEFLIYIILTVQVPSWCTYSFTLTVINGLTLQTLDNLSKQELTMDRTFGKKIEGIKHNSNNVVNYVFFFI